MKVESANSLSGARRGDFDKESMDLPTPKELKKRRNTKEHRREWLYYLQSPMLPPSLSVFSQLARVLELKEIM